MKSINIKGKNYIMVNERIKFFRENYRGYTLTSEIIELNEDSCVIKATISDAVNIQITVKGRYFINSPITPGQKIRGAKAINVVTVEAIIDKAIRLDASAYASFLFIPSIIFLSAYSVITIAPSTNIPTASISPNNTTIFMPISITPKNSIPIKNDIGIENPTRRPVLTPNINTTHIITRITDDITLF